MAQPLTDAINALTRYANETTGQSDQTLSDAVRTLCDGYGGGDIGGLANMVDVSDQNYGFGYFLSALKNGNTVGGTVTYPENFPNTETLLLSTGLTEIHGFMFANPFIDVSTGTGSDQTSKAVLVFVRTGGVMDFIGAMSSYTREKYGVANGTLVEQVPVNGTLRIDGGNIYYTARFNRNANYQILKANTLYEWLAW